MDSFVYGDFRVVVSDRSGVRVERAARAGGERDGGRGGGDAVGDRVGRPPRRASPPHAGAAGTLVGREEQLRLVRGAVRSRRMVEFTAECGSGKTALLRAVAPDAYIRVGAADLEDFFQDMVREFYDYPPGAPRLTVEECRGLLEQVVSVVALDDVEYDGEQIAQLRDALGGCAVLLGTLRPVVGRLGASHPLPGLAEQDAVSLLARELGRMIREAELPDARRLTGAVRGRPLALRQAAALVRHDGRDFGELARSAADDPGVLDQLAISSLGPPAKRALAVLALLDGAHLPARLIAEMAQVRPSAGRFEDLCARGLAEKRGDRFGLAAGKSQPYLDLLHHDLDVRVVLPVLGAWIEARDPSGTEAREAACAAAPLLRTAAGRGEWDAVLPLAATVERVLLVQGYWRSWQRVLDLGRSAARQQSDLAAEAYFAHQEGTLHLLEGRTEAARDALAHALELRTGLADAPGAEATRANLGFAAPESAKRGGRTGAHGGSDGGAPGSGKLSAGGGGHRRAGAGARRRHRLLVGVVAATALVAGAAVAVGVAAPGTLGGSGSSGGPGESRRASVTGPADGSSTSGAQQPDGATTVLDSPVGADGGGGSAGPSTASRPGGQPALKPLQIKGVRDYGDVHAGPAGDTPVTALTITNPNARPVPLDAITLPDPSDFAITSGSCRTRGDMSAGFLGAGGAPADVRGLDAKSSCTVSIRFTPTALGRRAGTLTVGYGTGKSVAVPLTGRAFATVKVMIAPDEAGHRDGWVDIEANGRSRRCEQATACTVRYFDGHGPVALKAHGDLTGSDGAGGSRTAGDTGGDDGQADQSADSQVFDDPAEGSHESEPGSATDGASGGTGGERYAVAGWTGPCAGAAMECDPTPGGDIATTVRFTPPDAT
jgi:hypothetical protein